MFDYRNLTITNNAAGTRTGVITYFTNDDNIETILNSPNYFKGGYVTPLNQSVFNRNCRVIIRDKRGDTYNMMVVRSGEDLLVKPYCLTAYPIFIRRTNVNLNQKERPPKGFLYSIQAFGDNYTGSGSTLLSLSKPGQQFATLSYAGTNPNGQLNVNYSNNTPISLFSGNDVVTVTNDQPMTGNTSIKIMLLFIGP